MLETSNSIRMKKIILKTSDHFEMTCIVAKPDQPTGKGIVVLQEAFGVNSHIQDMVRRFANEGFVAIAPELYHRTAPSGWTCSYSEFSIAQNHFAEVGEATILADVEACLDWLRTEGVRHLATIGFCLGGRAAYMSNSQPGLKAAISFYGGGIGTSCLHLAEKQNAPILLFWGGKDQKILSSQIQDATDALTTAKKIYTNIEISDADHGFFCDQRPSFHPKAAQLAWKTTLEFLHQHLVD